MRTRLIQSGIEPHDRADWTILAFYSVTALAIELDRAFWDGLAIGAEVLEAEGRVSHTGTSSRPSGPQYDRPERPAECPEDNTECIAEAESDD